MNQSVSAGRSVFSIFFFWRRGRCVLAILDCGSCNGESSTFGWDPHWRLTTISLSYDLDVLFAIITCLGEGERTKIRQLGMMMCLAPPLRWATPGSVNKSSLYSSGCRLDFRGGISVCYDHIMIPRRQNDGPMLWQLMCCSAESRRVWKGEKVVMRRGR